MRKSFFAAYYSRCSMSFLGIGKQKGLLLMLKAAAAPLYEAKLEVKSNYRRSVSRNL